MKQLITLAICACLAFATNAQNAPTGFWDIKFNSSRAAVTEQLKKKTKSAFAEKPDGYLQIDDMYDFEGYSAKAVRFQFRNDSLINGDVTYRSTATSSVFKMYDDIANKLVARYGLPKYETFNRPSIYDNDAKELLFKYVTGRDVILLKGWVFEKENKIVWLTVNTTVEVYVYIGEPTPLKMDIMESAASSAVAFLDGLKKSSEVVISDNSTGGIDGFWGLKFGITKTSAKAQILNSKKLKPSFEEDGDIMYENVKFGSDVADMVILHFADGILQQGVASFKSNAANIFNRYNAMVEKLQGKYGEPTHQRREFKPPFNESGNEVTALQTGYADVVTMWSASNGNTVMVLPNKDLGISIYYTAEKTAKQKAKEMNDY